MNIHRLIPFSTLLALALPVLQAANVAPARPAPPAPARTVAPARTAAQPARNAAPARTAAPARSARPVPTPNVRPQQPPPPRPRVRPTPPPPPPVVHVIPSRRVATYGGLHDTSNPYHLLECPQCRAIADKEYLRHLDAWWVGEKSRRMNEQLNRIYSPPPPPPHKKPKR